MEEKYSIFVMSEKNDSGLDDILINLKLQGSNYFHVTEESILVFSEFKIKDFKIIDIKIEKINSHEKIYLSSIKGFLYRGGYFKMKLDEEICAFRENGLYEVALNLEDELSFIKNLLMNKLLKVDRVLGNPYTSIPNKIEMLQLASQSGLKVPKIHIISEEYEFDYFKKKNFITKPLTDNVIFNFEDSRHATFTIELKNIESLKNSFFPSLIQEKVEKKYELRVFFVDNLLFASAIQSKKFSLDYRKEDAGVFDAVPYTFNRIEQEYILTFIKSSKQKTGAIDLIRDVNGELYFLEINPLGAFEWYSESCNYNIPKKIAEYFI